MKWPTSNPRKPKEQNDNTRIVKDLEAAEKEEAAAGRRIIAFEPHRKALWRIYTAPAFGHQAELAKE